MLELKSFTLTRKNICVANTLNLSLKSGNVYCILGPNGVGKSSLINAIFGILPYKGEILYNNAPLKGQKHISFMPQDTNVDVNLTALEIVLLGLIDHLGMYLSDSQIKQAATLMEELGILHLAQRDILSLSGGQRQMIMFAQTLIKNPKILLLDEPVSALDMHHQCVLLECVRKTTRARNLLTIMVLHDLSLSAQFADSILMLSEGKIQAQGNPKEVLQKDLIENLYKVKTEIFYNADGIPIIATKGAIYK
ncbi:ABC transporter ATP-binding protein [Helicobacter sp. MIT 11-5569]|uniref:ABC transporter ATP-binding protein n=1 Tax=Helicobacter sp. MIT 11-5569 TaxID=1548151 RepID=UPI00051FECF3|nr:ABC transporter ATP-binding protein [Helicobacter sp. MIT 11-5569]TLD84429.1 ABC transporter ATP-binding protein [Helicobacter sp. MIT 11-5569]